MLFLLGCSDLLEETPKGQVLGNSALESIDGLDAALTGAYQPWLHTYHTGFTSPAIVAVVMGSDDLTTQVGSNKADFREFDQFNTTTLNGRQDNIWNGCYKSIQGANNIINNYEKLLGTGDDTRVNQIAGEAYFIRAYSYYWLVRLWGRIPLLMKAEVTAEVLDIGLTEPTEIYDLILSDLALAEVKMGPTKQDPGRPSQGSAKALLADVYLTMGGWPINDASSYALAAAKAKEVIDNKGSYGFDLVPELEDLWTGLPSNGTPEEVFALQLCGSCDWFYSNAVYGAATTPTELTFGFDDYFAEITFFNEFPEGIRKDITFSTEFTKPDGTTVTWQELASKHPYYEKFTIKGENTFTTSMPLMLIRYPHVLLTYAEAQARSEGNPDADAYTALNATRLRAGLPVLSGLSNTDFIDAVVQERAWEFAGEYTRWFDLVRLELVEEANANKHPDDLPVIGTITKEDYWLKIPAGDALINPNLE